MDFKGSFERLLHHPVVIMMADESLSVLGPQLRIGDDRSSGLKNLVVYVYRILNVEHWGLERFDRAER